MQSEHVVACDLDGGKALLDLSKGEYFKLNKTASFIWESLSEPKSLDDLVASVTERFSVKPEQCRADIETILTQFRKEGMIVAA